jgi:hypothetical protein
MLGVAHMTTSFSGREFRSIVSWLALPDFQSRADGVGQDPPPLPLVRRSNIRRTDSDRWRDSVAQIFQVASGSSKSVQRHVLEEDEAWPALADDPGDVRPDAVVSLVRLPASLAGDAPGLAGEPRSDEIHSAMPASAVERRKVRPDRSLIQGSRLHRADQDRSREGFPLHVADRARRDAGDAQCEAESSVAGAQFEGT